MARPKKIGNVTACYERLSHDDELQGESNSISNQKRVLEAYAEDHGFTNIIHFTDDGISGTRFDRPGFQSMMSEVRAGNVAQMLIKDMSRFGRDYLQVGTYMELLRQNNVRLIAINDGVDTLRGDDEFAPFRNIMNEWYARDTSKKIRSAFQARNLAGKPTASSPTYGYLKSPENKDQWVVDPEGAEIVKRIFRLTMEGKGPYQIAKILEADKVEIPAYHMKQLGVGLWQTREIPHPYRWTSSTIVHILENPVYLGHTCNFKTRKHFKDKKSHYVDQDQWTFIYNTHEAIIDQDTYDNVQRMRANIRRYPDGWGEAHPLGGLMFCADCGSKMYVHRTSNGERHATFNCAGYTKQPVGTRCPSPHRVDADAVMELIRQTLKEIVQFSKEDETEFLRIVQEAVDSQQTTESVGQQNRLQACRSRMAELDKLMNRIYEDNALGKLPDRRYLMLEAQYTAEQEQLEKEFNSLQVEAETYEKTKNAAGKFVTLVKKYQDFEELTTPMLIEFIDRIVVHEREIKGCPDSPQKIEIYFNFVGQFCLPHEERPFTPEEIAEAERREKLRRKRHEAYLRRKESGWQGRYYAKTKDEKLAKRHAANEAIRAEDRENGVYYLPHQQNAEQTEKGEAL